LNALRLGRNLVGFAISLLAALGPLRAAAADDLVVGQVVPMSAPIYASISQEYTAGAQAYFASVNAKGGIHGRKIRAIVKDDGFAPDKTLQATRELLAQDAIALFGYIGTPQVQNLLKNNVLAEAGIALLAPWSGAPELREPTQPNLFHVRAGSAEEGARMVEQLHTLGMRRFAVLHQDDTFGRAGLAGVESGVKRRGLKLAAVGSYPPRTPEEVDAAVSTIAAANPEAVILVATSPATTAFTKKLRATGNRAQLFTMSSTNFRALVKNLGEDGARGIGIAQVMPFPYTPSTPIAREFRDAMGTYAPDKNISHASMESFVAAKVLVEAIRRAGPNPTRQKVLSSLNKMSNFDLGGFKIAFAPDNHEGSNFVEITVIGQDGKLRR
jgi:branched-chain amino acid transport system substrate-binding protein